MLPNKRKAVRFFGAVDARGLGSSPATDLPFLRQEFYVWSESGEPVGPVSVDQIARGILAGRVPLQAFVTRPGEPEWRKVLETREIVRALELSSEVETIDVMDDEEELVEIFDDVDDLGEAIEKATHIYDANELRAQPYGVSDGSEDGTGHFVASDELAAEHVLEEPRSREGAAYISTLPESELPIEPAEDPEAEAGTDRYVAAQAAAAAAVLDAHEAQLTHEAHEAHEAQEAQEAHDGPVATALATALSKAAEHGRWDVVLELARQLETRRPGPPAPDSPIFSMTRGIKPSN